MYRFFKHSQKDHPEKSDNLMLKNISLCISLFFIISCQSQKSSSEENTWVEEKEISLSERLVQDQLDAYNNRDLDAFLIPYSDSVKIYNSLDEFGYQGKESMKGVYTQWFGALDSLHCELVNRIVSGNTVIDHERLSFRRRGLNSVGSSEAIAIYKIKDGKISEVRFTDPN